MGELLLGGTLTSTTCIRLLVAGQVQSRKCIEDVIRFAWEEKLFLLADEVRRCPAGSRSPGAQV